MLRALTEIGSYRGDCAIKTWLCTIARNLWLDHLKKAENRNLPLDAVPDAPDEANLEARLSDKMQALEIHRMLHRLEEPYREIFSLRIFAELSFKEIGAVFGKTENWARVTYHRARLKLRERMEEQ
jgi:RNA polymerase sigma-70 factor (ECF subfamily)